MSDLIRASEKEAAMTDLTNPSEFMTLLGIQFDEVQPTRVTGSVAADERHHQPWGLVHGGLYTTAIETFATTGAYQAVKDRGQQAVGVANATDFLRPHQSGRLNVVATAIHQGHTQQLWQVEIYRAEDDKLVARGQVRLQNIDS
jgi:1,4-dihydroxy-2-naphthoyl-CoA hydrolase